MCDLLLCDNLLFGEDLHGIDATCVLFADLEDAAKGAAADELHKLEIAGSEGTAGLGEIRWGDVAQCDPP